MEDVNSLFRNVGLILMGIIGGMGVISFGIAAFYYLTAQGDQQNMAKAKNAFIGAIIGIVIGGMAFALPRIISQGVVEPSGGQNLTASAGASSCDSIFKSQLVAQRPINNAARMNELISLIQSSRNECRQDTWRPVVYNLDSVATLADKTKSAKQKCVTGAHPSSGNDWPDASVNSVLVPIGLRIGGDPSKAPRDSSGRDADNNIMVYFADRGPKETSAQFNPPADNSVCWLYSARAGTWVGQVAP